MVLINSKWVFACLQMPPKRSTHQNVSLAGPGKSKDLQGGGESCMERCGAVAEALAGAKRSIKCQVKSADRETSKCDRNMTY